MIVQIIWPIASPSWLLRPEGAADCGEYRQAAGIAAPNVTRTSLMPLLGVKQTLIGRAPMSAFDPKRTFGREDWKRRKCWSSGERATRRAVAAIRSDCWVVAECCLTWACFGAGSKLQKRT